MHQALQDVVRYLLLSYENPADKLQGVTPKAGTRRVEEEPNGIIGRR